MTIKNKNNDTTIGSFFGVLLVTVVSLLIGIGLAYLSNLLAILTSSAPGIIQTILYGLGTLALGFAAFIFLGGGLVVVGMSLYSIIVPDEKKGN